MLEMPTGTGKTVTLLSFVTSYQQYCSERGELVPKLVYCTRTVQEMEKVLKELKEVTKYRLSECGKTSCDILAIGLSSRRNLCVHETISKGERSAVDAGKTCCVRHLVLFCASKPTSRVVYFVSCCSQRAAGQPHRGSEIWITLQARLLHVIFFRNSTTQRRTETHLCRRASTLSRR